MAEYGNQREPQVEDLLFQILYRCDMLRLFNRSWNTEFQRSITFQLPGSLQPNAKIDVPADAQALETGPTWTSATLEEGPTVTRTLLRGTAQHNLLIEREQLGGAQAAMEVEDALANMMATGTQVEGDTPSPDCIDERIRAELTGVNVAATPVRNLSDPSKAKGQLITVGTAGSVFLAPPSGSAPPAITGGADKLGEAIRSGVASAMYGLRQRRLVGQGTSTVQGPGGPTQWVLVAPLGIDWVWLEWMATQDGFIPASDIAVDATLDLGIRGSDLWSGMLRLFGVDVLIDLNLPAATSSKPWSMYLVPAASRALWAQVEMLDRDVARFGQGNTGGAYVERVVQLARLSHTLLRPDLITRIDVRQK